MWITYFNPHFCILEMPAICMGKFEKYSFSRRHSGAIAALLFLFHLDCLLKPGSYLLQVVRDPEQLVLASLAFSRWQPLRFFCV